MFLKQGPARIVKLFILTFLIPIPFFCQAQQQAYQLYDGTGNQVDYSEIISSVLTSDIVLFGEHHDNPISHWLEYELLVSLKDSTQLSLGAEMLEADNQRILDDYLSGKIDKKSYDTLIRKWKNYDTDYAPLIDFAKTNRLKFTATNVPRRYAAMVHKNGFQPLDTLTKKEKAWIAPLPIQFDPQLPRYQGILKMMGDHGSPDLVKAQALKDATMAYFIYTNLQKKGIFVHFNGAFHSDYHEGIAWYLTQFPKKPAICTISTVTQSNIHELEAEYINKADFIICIDENMTRTY